MIRHHRLGIAILPLASLAVAATAPIASASGSASATNGRITGTVTAADTGAPIGKFCAVAAIDGKVKATDCRPHNGSYHLEALAPGVYDVGFTTFTGLPRAGNYAPSWYGGGADRSTATPVSVTAGTETSGIDAALQLGGTIAGKATDARTGRPLGAKAESCFYAKAVKPIAVPVAYDKGLMSADCSNVFHHGRYALAGLPTGTYVVYYDNGHLNGPYFPQWYRGARHKSQAKRLHVTIGKTLGGINARMARSGQIVGKVVDAKTGKPLNSSDFYVVAYNARGRMVTPDYWVGGNGVYHLPQLTTGNYRVAFTGAPYGYQDVWFDGSKTFKSAADVHVTTGKNTRLPTVRLHRLHRAH
ncbi:MAG TPA: hypothetical protein VG708_09860 [Mycobacteriales bacterium]|nr:hypothetical protein [Mycobacteriales bacterium]